MLCGLWMVIVGSRGRGSPLIEDNYILIYDASYFCLYLWILLVCLFLAYVFEYMDVSARESREKKCKLILHCLIIICDVLLQFILFFLLVCVFHQAATKIK